MPRGLVQDSILMCRWHVAVGCWLHMHVHFSGRRMKVPSILHRCCAGHAKSTQRKHMQLTGRQVASYHEHKKNDNSNARMAGTSLAAAVSDCMTCRHTCRVVLCLGLVRLSDGFIRSQLMTISLTNYKETLCPLFTPTRGP